MSGAFVVEIWGIKTMIKDAQQEENSPGCLMEWGILRKCVKPSRNKTLGKEPEAKADQLKKAGWCTLQCKASKR